jgi:acetyltransferase-like isoleucine patch superfamily enzyme
MRRVKEYKYKGRGNSLHLLWKVSNPLRTVLNLLIIYTCRFLPSLTLKRFLYQLIGMKIGAGTSVGFGAMFDFFFPELISIGENSIIGYNTTILCHEFLIDKWKKGKVEMGDKVMIGAQCLIMPGVKIGNRAQIASYSLVNKDIPPGQTWGGIPARKIK